MNKPGKKVLGITPVDYAQLANKVFTMRLEGASPEEIAAEYKISPLTVVQIIKREMDALVVDTEEKVEAFRTIQVARLEMMLAPQLKQAKGGDRFAAETAAKLIDAENKLLGLNTIEMKVEHTNKVSISLADTPLVQQAEVFALLERYGLASALLGAPAEAEVVEAEVSEITEEVQDE